MNEETKAAAADYRASKEAAPEALAARSAMQLEQAVANYAYYSDLANQALVQIKTLTAELATDKDPNLAVIAQAADAVAVDAIAEPPIGLKG